MKHKYCLIRLYGEREISPFVYVVWVGSSLRESTSLALVEEYCKDCGWYFKRWSANVDSALEFRFKMARVDGTKTAKQYQTIQLSIQQCYQTIIDDSFAMLEANYTMTQFELWQRFRNTIQYHTTMNARLRNTSCPPSRRKYLSPRRSRAFYELAPAVAAIVLLIVLDQLICTHILNHLF